MKGTSGAMGDMEAGLNELQGNVTATVRPSGNHFKPTGLLLALAVAIIVALMAFTVASRFTGVDRNAVAIKQSCHRRNEAIAAFNKKFFELSHLFDVILANRPPDQPPPADAVVDLLEEFKKPVPLFPCEISSTKEGS